MEGRGGEDWEDERCVGWGMYAMWIADGNGRAERQLWKDQPTCAWR